MILQNKTFLSIALSMSLLFGSVMPALGMRTASVRLAALQKAAANVPQNSQPNSSDTQEQSADATKPTKKKLSWKAKISQKYNNLKQRISEFFHENPEATVASVAVGSAICTALALWCFWDFFAPPVNPGLPVNPGAPEAQPPVANPDQAHNQAAPQAQPLADHAHADNSGNANAQPLANPAQANDPAAAPQSQSGANANANPVANPNSGAPEVQQPAANQQPPLPPVPWVPTENVIANSACDVLELPLAQNYQHRLQLQVANAIGGFEERNVVFRLNVPARIVQIRCAQQNGPECGYHAIKNNMVILNELVAPQGNLQARLADDALCQQFFGFNPDQGHGVWRQRILAAQPDPAVAQQRVRADAIGQQIYHNNQEIGNLRDLINIENIDAARNAVAIEALRAAQLELQNEINDWENERARLREAVRQNNVPHVGGLPLGESDQNGDWLGADALQHVINHERRRPADNAPQLLQDFNTPITVIDQLEQVGNGVPGVDPTLAARAGFARAGAYRHAFVVTTARVVNGRARGGHYFAAVLDRNADGDVRWYVADSMNRPVVNSLALRNLIMAVQGVRA
jgi:hypothetical protein